MSDTSVTLNSGKMLSEFCGGDFGVKEERYRININRKIRCLTRQMEQSFLNEYSVCDPVRYQDMLSRMRERINERP